MIQIHWQLIAVIITVLLAVAAGWMENVSNPKYMYWWEWVILIAFYCSIIMWIIYGLSFIKII